MWSGSHFFSDPQPSTGFNFLVCLLLFWESSDEDFARLWLFNVIRTVVGLSLHRRACTQRWFVEMLRKCSLVFLYVPPVQPGTNIHVFLLAVCALSCCAGSSTACIVVLDRRSHRLHTCNLGDSGFLVVRGGEVVHRSNEQQHYFNTPFQLSIAPPGAEGAVLSDRWKAHRSVHFC